ncbi:hypothetical protein B0T13DRAFT_449430 [Neurospora crassa]|nr:hypothetical protein B0T13DRAFT_449430 [Neurospora crassa]
MGRKDRNPTWREANIWEKPTRRYSTWATARTWRTNTWASEDVDPDPEAQKHTAEEAKTKKPSRWRWRSLACGMKSSPSLRHVQARFPLDHPSPLPFPVHFSVPSTTQEPGTSGKGGPMDTIHVSTSVRLDPWRKHQTTPLDWSGHGVTMNAGTSTAKREPGMVNTASTPSSPRTVSQRRNQDGRNLRPGRDADTAEAGHPSVLVVNMFHAAMGVTETPENGCLQAKHTRPARSVHTFPSHLVANAGISRSPPAAAASCNSSTYT